MREFCSQFWNLFARQARVLKMKAACLCRGREPFGHGKISQKKYPNLSKFPQSMATQPRSLHCPYHHHWAWRRPNHLQWCSSLGALHVKGTFMSFTQMLSLSKSQNMSKRYRISNPFQVPPTFVGSIGRSFGNSNVCVARRSRKKIIIENCIVDSSHACSDKLRFPTAARVVLATPQS